MKFVLRHAGFWSALWVSEFAFMFASWAAMNGKVSWESGLEGAFLLMITAVIVGIWVDRPK